ncbi:hypothetical protein OS493_008017 [Desmophyllum pertusum]|uniref:Myb-like domain-containing protein n=1 Tax=Desmophyllum pertusum TaxID=174260 RepID=A0A9W9YIA8_9CNID|nr:hypothetical protein OS493_008017 [Desmophyllum pertusum]
MADPLSRLLQADEQAEPSLAHKVGEEYVRFVAVTATPKAMTTREIEEASAEDKEFIELWHCIKDGSWKTDQCKQYIPVSEQVVELSKRKLLQIGKSIYPKKVCLRNMAMKEVQTQMIVSHLAKQFKQNTNGILDEIPDAPMEWTEEHDVLMLRKMMKGSVSRGVAWDSIAEKLNQSDSPKFGIKDKRGVRERWLLLR